METEKKINDNFNAFEETEVFSQRLDFYWQFTSAYLFVLVIYAVYKSLIENINIFDEIYDPVIILLGAFVLVSLFGLLLNLYKKRTITIAKDYIVFKTRFSERSYALKDIEKISFGTERKRKPKKRKRLNNKGYDFYNIKIKVNSRRRFIRIRPSSFWNEKGLIQRIALLKKQLS